MALSVPLSRFTSRVGGGSAFFVRRMRHSVSFRLLVWTIGGFLFALVGIFTPGLNFAVDFLSYPAFKILDWLVTTQYPPNDGSNEAIGLLGILAQWTIIGFLAGIWRVWRGGKKHTPNKSPEPTPVGAGSSASRTTL